MAEAETQEAIRGLATAGFSVRVDPEAISRIVELEKRMAVLGETEGWNDKIAGLEGVEFFVRQEMAHLAQLLTMADKEFAEYIGLVREHRKLVQSLVEQPKVKAVAKT